MLTKFHANVLIWILLPQLLIGICVTHEGENHILNHALKKTKTDECRAGNCSCSQITKQKRPFI